MPGVMIYARLYLDRLMIVTMKSCDAMCGYYHVRIRWPEVSIRGGLTTHVEKALLTDT